MPATQAIREMSEYIERAVETTMGDQYYAKALECVRALRNGCKQSSIGESDAFNRWLRRVRAKWEKSPTSDGFWQLLVASNISLVHRDEADDTDVAPDDARDFLRAPAESLAADTQAAPQDAAADDEVDELDALLAEADD